MTEQILWKAAPETRHMNHSDFAQIDHTTVYWLGSGGVFINSRGTLLMIDPVLGYDNCNADISEAGFPFLQPPPVSPTEIEKLDAILYTHADYDHMTPGTAVALYHTGGTYHGTGFVGKTLEEFGIQKERICVHDIHASFRVGNVLITLTPALHQWTHPGGWQYAFEDCCGYIIDTPDGRVWLPGDSVLLEEHKKIENVDLMFMDISNDPYHFGLDNAIMLANTLYPADLILYHYGTYYAPTKKAFCGDPDTIQGKIVDSERVFNIGAGVQFVLRSK